MKALIKVGEAKELGRNRRDVVTAYLYGQKEPFYVYTYIITFQCTYIIDFAYFIFYNIKVTID